MTSRVRAGRKGRGYIPAPVIVPPSSTATTRIGATWTDTRPAASMDSTIAVHDMQMQHMIEFGAGNPWPSQASMSAPQFATQLDPFMQDVRDAGATQRVLCFHKAPGWMKASGNTSDDNRPLNAQFDNFATISAQAAARYTDFQWGVVWNEYKGFWDLANNRPDWVTYKTFYDKVYTAVKAVRPTMKVGGPYTTMISSDTVSGSNPSSVVTFPGGRLDQRWMDAFSHFVANCQFDFLCWDGGSGHAPEQLGGLRYGGHTSTSAGVTAEQQLAKVPNMIAWMRSLSGAANTCPILCTETYVQDVGYAAATSAPPPGYPGGVVGGNWGGGYGYTASQVEDYFIEMCRRTQAVSPNGPVYFLTWFHPQFWPQVVNKTDDFTWANTTSNFAAKVTNWHTNGV